MKTGLLITGVAIAALVAGGASATIHKSHHKSHAMSAEAMYAPPTQPIPYAQLDSYLAAKPSQRASMGDSGASMGASPAPQASDTAMTPPAAAPAPAGDQMGGMSGSSAAPPATGDTGAAAAPPPAGDTGAAATPPAPEATQGAPDGSSPPPK